ncbi:MAG: HlyD family efflux transporter periplasmic adaptor subunit [Lachnospiraceae bacterium]|jgi:multidrug resistance efflux pump|nr:HlyD family efflux transporter periplasmic adaptor subunit [Lachnospiraceae bacterium]
MVNTMNENGTKRKEWVKNAAIVFLIILLLLTFFSNTIQNYSLPEVATQYVESGSITAKIRGMGVVESGDPYNVKIKEVRQVSSVEVKVGDKVEKGQVLCYLTEEDSQELDQAKTELEQKQQALEKAQFNFEKQLLTGSYDVSIMQNAGNTGSVSGYLNQIYTAKSEMEAAQDKVDEWTLVIANIDRQLAFNPYSVDVSKEAKAVNEAQAALDSINNELTSARNWLTSLDAQIEQEKAAISVSSGDASKLANLVSQRLTANQNVINLESRHRSADQTLENAKAALDAKKGTTDLNNVLNQQKAFAELSLGNAKDFFELKKKAYDELIKNIGDTYALSEASDAIALAQKEVEDAQAKVDKLVTGAMGSEVTAPISGLITAVNVKSGVETPSDGIVFTMQPEGKGYTLSFSVTNQQAQRVSVGDQAELVNAWRYDDIQVTLASIKPDPNNPGQNKLLTFDVTGESVIAGQSLNVSVGQKSANYDMTVPNSAIREDSNGKFILVITSKSSPIGTRYFASRVDVEVLASDDTKSAISGAVESYSYVITTSTKPVEAGKQVRLADN